jgi:four helix bundle protein
MSYDNLEVYRKSYKLAISMYKYVKENMPKEELYELSSQIRRAATSIPLNIAEGYAKKESQAEFRRYLMMAKGSAAEMKVLTDMCKDMGYMTKEHHQKYRESYEEISKMLSGLIKRIEN